MGLDKPKDSVLVLLAALIGGSGAGVGWNMGVDYRPHPYTSIDAAARKTVVDRMTAAFKNRLHILEKRVRVLEKDHQTIKLDIGRESRAMPKVRLLEYKVQNLMENLKECCHAK